MIAVDTNILIYSVHQTSPWHERARAKLVDLAEGGTPWAIPWPCIHEFVAIATHPRIFESPMPLSDALGQVREWQECPSLYLLAERPGYWEIFEPMTLRAKVTGPRTHDARIAALCRLHGVKKLWSADRDLGRFPEIAVVNPLIG